MHSPWFRIGISLWMIGGPANMSLSQTQESESGTGPAATTKVSYPVDVGIYFARDAVTYQIWPLNHSNKILSFTSNTPSTMALDVNINGYGVSTDIWQSKGNDPEDDYGKTKYRQFKVNKYFQKTGLDAYYHRSVGVYLDEHDVFDTGPQWIHKRVYYRPDVEIHSFGFNVFHVTNPEAVPFEAGLNLRSFPHEPGWSMLYSISHDSLAIEAHGSMIPESHQEYFTDLNDYDGGMFSGVLLGVGIGGVYPFGNFLVGGTYSLGWGLAEAQYDVNGFSVGKEIDFRKSNIRVMTGYRYESYFFNLYGYLDEKYFTVSSDTMFTYQTNFIAFGVNRTIQ